MNREDIIAMAREVFACNFCALPVSESRIEHFAALVAAAEREACAKVCEDNAGIIDHPNLFMGGPSNNAKRKAMQFADAIRARGQA